MEDNLANRKLFPDSINPLPDAPSITPHGLLVHAIEPPQKAEPMLVQFALHIPANDEARLEEMVAKGETISPDELNRSYVANAADVERLVTWLKDQKFEIVQVTPDSIYAKATPAQLESSLGVNMVRVTRDGLTYTAAQNAPSLPNEVAASVRSINGLQPFRQAHKHIRRRAPKEGNRAARNGAGRGGPAPEIQNAPPFLVNEIAKAYNADGLGVTGKGQTIAILIDTLPTDADLEAFWKKNNLPVTMQQIDKITVGSGALPPIEGEETLDAS